MAFPNYQNFQQYPPQNQYGYPPQNNTGNQAANMPVYNPQQAFQNLQQQNQVNSAIFNQYSQTYSAMPMSNYYQTMNAPNNQQPKVKTPKGKRTDPTHPMANNSASLLRAKSPKQSNKNDKSPHQLPMNPQGMFGQPPYIQMGMSQSTMFSNGVGATVTPTSYAATHKQLPGLPPNKHKDHNKKKNKKKAPPPPPNVLPSNGQKPKTKVIPGPPQTIPGPPPPPKPEKSPTPNDGYGLQAPDQQFVQAVGLYSTYQPYGYYQAHPFNFPNQPQFNGFQPPQMINNGNIMNSNSKKSKKDKKEKKKNKKKKDKKKPPPPPGQIINNNNNTLLTPNQSNDIKNDSIKNESDSEDTSENDDFKGFKLDDPGNLPSAADVVKKKKEKSKHQKFDSRNEFLKRRGVSGVPLDVQKKLAGITDDTSYASSHLKLIALDGKIASKSPKTAEFLSKCLRAEVLFNGMDDEGIKKIVSAMYRVKCPKGECIIKQNEYGDAYFVIESGRFDIIHEDVGMQPKIVGEMGKGKAFGEGSLLYSIPRAATLRATENSVVWGLDAARFIEIREKLSKGVNDKTAKKVKALQKISLFGDYHQQDLVQIAGALKEIKFKKDEMMIQQGDDADRFFIIKTGTAVAIKESKNGLKQEVKEYSDGDFFGERGLIKNEKRAASVQAKSTVKCYVFMSQDFHELFKNSLETFNNCIKGYDEDAFKKLFNSRFKNLVQCKLNEFVDLGILGVGSFGRVSLVKDPKTGKTYSLKKVRKNKVIETGQQEHVRNERAVLAILDSEFCCRMYGTYQDKSNIYFLMEPVLGGELFTVLRWNKRFSEKTARFYAACVILGFEHLHSKNIIYRDLKPENLLISKNGYCKVVDFGFAKRRNNSCTLCGTPEYLSPEVIQNWPQGFGVDWWALGIFIFEMVIGHAPFLDDPNVKMYEKILTYDVEFPDTVTITDKCKDLILRLLNKDAYKRLGSSLDGASQIQKHVWFQGLDWEKMRDQDVSPPYKPNITDDEDVSNYDNYPEEEPDDVPLKDPNAYEWCEDF